MGAQVSLVARGGMLRIPDLSGDHLYRMDYHNLCNTETQASLSVVPVAEPASSFGLMKIDDSGRVIDSGEKPKGESWSRCR